MASEVDIMLLVILIITVPFSKTQADKPSSGPLCSESHCKEDLCLNGTCVSGCKDGFIEPSCLYNCSETCKNQICRDSGTGIGVCTDGCIPDYWGDSCKSPCPGSCNTCTRNTGTNCTSCPEFRYGTLCEGNCRASCPITGCRIDGSCKQESDVCELGKWGLKCLWGCSNGCLYDACNRTSGFCLHECKEGYFGYKCGSTCNSNCKRQICDIEGNCKEGCDTGFYGGDCELHCVKNCRRRLCERDSGDCSNGCSDGYYGSQCNTTCLLGCPVCHGRTGECLEVFGNSIAAGDITTQKPSEANLTGYYVLASVGIILLCATVAVILAKRFWNTLRSKNEVHGKLLLRKLPDPPVVLSQYEYNEIDENEMDQSNQQASFTTSDAGTSSPLELGVENSRMSRKYSEPIISEDVADGLQEQIMTTGNRSPESKAASLFNGEIEVVFDNILYRKGCITCTGETTKQGTNSKYLSPVTNQRQVHSV